MAHLSQSHRRRALHHRITNSFGSTWCFFLELHSKGQRRRKGKPNIHSFLIRECKGLEQIIIRLQFENSCENRQDPSGGGLLLIVLNLRNQTSKTQQSLYNTNKTERPPLPCFSRGGHVPSWRISPFAQLSSVASVQPVGPKELRASTAAHSRRSGDELTIPGAPLCFRAPPSANWVHPRAVGPSDSDRPAKPGDS